jgi:hypothetical protein
LKQIKDIQVDKEANFQITTAEEKAGTVKEGVEINNDLKHWNEKEHALKVIQDELEVRPHAVDSEQFVNAFKLII